MSEYATAFDAVLDGTGVTANTWQSAARRLAAEVRDLRRWKDEALPVISGLQELGRELGVRLGASITGPAAVEKAVELRERAEAHAAAIDTLTDHLAHMDRAGGGIYTADFRDGFRLAVLMLGGAA